MSDDLSTMHDPSIVNDSNGNDSTGSATATLDGPSGGTLEATLDGTDESRSLTELITGSPPVAMVMTMIGGVHTSRPVTVAEIDGNRLSFLVSLHAEWVEAIHQLTASVHVTCSNDTHSTYLSLNGAATVSLDTGERERLWSAPAGVWFSGPDDPTLAVLHFDVLEGRYWDGPDGLLGRGLALVKAMLTGTDREMGTYGHIDTER